MQNMGNFDNVKGKSFVEVGRYASRGSGKFEIFSDCF